tara:strand:- start:321 stop:662 length:342 start_codon:yes stop_codon:yes gene_type:complete
MNTQENNRLIAEFMGWDVKRPSTIPSNLHLSNLELDNGEIFEPLFHSSWDWLMPVVEKIESDERYDVDILQYGTRIREGQKEIVNNIADISFDKKIEHTYQAVVEFIKQYNNQ